MKLDIKSKRLINLDGQAVDIPKKFYYLTCHRQENTDMDEKLSEILKAMNLLDAPIVYPVHPRNHDRAKRICEKNGITSIILT